MANTYYVHSSALVPGTKARAEDVNSRLDGVEDGFDKLPASHIDAPGTKGFSEVFKIVDATALDHPASAKQVRDGVLTYSEDTGIADAYIATLSTVPSAYVAGMEVKIKVANTNTGASTINVNGLGVKSIKLLTGDALAGGEMVSGRVVGLRYDGTDFIILDGMTTVHSHNDLYYTKTEVATAVQAAMPVGAVIPFIGGYFTNGANAGFTSVIGNTAAAINALLNGDGWYVCNGAAINIVGSTIFAGAGRYLPNITDSRFLMGTTSAGSVGGSNTSAHTHSVGGHTHTIAHTHNIDPPNTSSTDSGAASTGGTTLSEAMGAIHSHTATGAVVTGGSTLGSGGTRGDMPLVINNSAGGTAHSHSMAHTHDVNIGAFVSNDSNSASSGTSTTFSSGSATVTENRPTFLTCHYIMKAA